LEHWKIKVAGKAKDAKEEREQVRNGELKFGFNHRYLCGFTLKTYFY
jgi:hypothetical protein